MKIIGNLIGASLSIELANIVKQHSGLNVAIVDDFAMAAKLESELSYFGVDLHFFPDWETLPYDNFSPHQDIISARLSTLAKLPSSTGVLVVPVASVMHRLCPPEFIGATSFILACKDKLDLSATRRQLESSGYQYTSQVMEHGEFSIRGSILDVFPMGSKTPYRIDLFDNEVETIRIFDPDTQLSNDTVESINLLSAREYNFSEQAISLFRSKWREIFGGDPRNCPIYQDVSQGIKSTGLEYYLALFFEKTSTLFDYLPDNTQLIRVGNLEASANEFWQLIQQRYEQYSHDVQRPILSPSQVFIPIQELFAKFKSYRQTQLLVDRIPDSPTKTNYAAKKISNLSLDSIKDFVLTNPQKILFCAESAGRRVVLEEILARYGIKLELVKSGQLFANTKTSIAIAPFDTGVVLEDLNLIIITENELLGRKIVARKRGKERSIDSVSVISNLSELTIGSPVVHLEHGIGRYQGLKILKIDQQAQEFLELKYANNNTLYVPVTSLHLISRYSGTDPENAPLHCLGSDKWAREKSKATKQLRDIAAQLLEVYAKREAAHGFACHAPNADYEKFAASFPFEETVDQQNAIEQVMKDLISDRPMDRVVCGDVGFGKTEVAMRAAFLSVASGKQVAVLVPTTLLAQQHYQTFIDRFADFAFNVEVISRFKTRKEQSVIEENIKAGKCDIVIGTHKLLQDEIKFKNLGLLIIDEEHRFGVKQKEKFKAFRSHVDILTLTATPIPRTLNMSMSGMRDLSIITTPPAKRLSVKTFVRERSNSLIQEAINRELSRGGQVFYLHNEVETILNTANEISELLPNARVAVAHGQMHERELEKIMNDFYHRRFNVLVCTTIIETGIDIPTANTIIIDRADKLGLAQLHQLRGRVGRSHHQAYAFCLRPPANVISKDAEKRLNALESLETLGAGFILATHDLEIRGAGELLGEQQRGNLQTIGFSLFMELLDNTVNALKSGKHFDDNDLLLKDLVEIDLQIPALIPDDYLPDVHSRLILYKRISNAKTNDALDELKIEIIDRFGVLPESVNNLFSVTKLKLLAQSLGIKAIKVGAKTGKIQFSDKPNIEVTKIIALVQNNPKEYKFSGTNAINFTIELSTADYKIDFIHKLLLKLSK